MNDQPKESELIAYIDGELPPQRRRVVEQTISAVRDLRRQLRFLVRLGKTARRVVRDSTPPVSHALRSRVEHLMLSGPSADPAVSSPQAFGARPTAIKSVRRVRPAVAAAAACLIVGATWFAAHWLVATPARTAAEAADHAGLPAQLISSIRARHVKCDMMGSNFGDASFPHVLADAGPVIRQYLGDAVEIPDLSSLGLEFAGVGPCQFGNGKTLHWLFRNPVVPGRGVSVFVQLYTHQVTFAPHTAVVISGPNEKLPMLVWHDDKFVYYLIGDDFQTTSKTAAAFGVSFG